MAQNAAKEFYKILETISAQAKTGVAFSNHPYDLERYKNILKALDNMYRLLTKDETLSNILSILREMPTEIGDREYITPKVAVATAIFNKHDDICFLQVKKCPIYYRKSIHFESCDIKIIIQKGTTLLSKSSPFLSCTKSG